MGRRFIQAGTPIDAIVTSLRHHFEPHEVRLIMIDPKMLELIRITPDELDRLEAPSPDA